MTRQEYLIRLMWQVEDIKDRFGGERYLFWGKFSCPICNGGINVSRFDGKSQRWIISHKCHCYDALEYEARAA